MNTIKLAPSILAADFTRLGEQVAETERAGADRVHVDVMDGHFVPNLTMGPAVVRSLRPATRLPLEVHLMVEHPERFVGPFADAGADSFLVHVECGPRLTEAVREARQRGKQVGVVLNPDTPADRVEGLLGEVDLVLVMTVHPGFSGQAFREDVLPKIRQVRELIERRRPGLELEVDGGIGPATAPRAVAAGANVLVAASAIFRGEGGITAAMRRLRESVAPS